MGEPRRRQFRARRSIGRTRGERNGLDQMKSLVAASKWKRLGARGFLDVREGVEQFPDISSDDYVLRHALGKNRELAQRRQAFEFAELERARLEGGQLDWEIL